MRQKPGTQKPRAEKVVKDIGGRTRNQHSAEEKIRKPGCSVELPITRSTVSTS
ncbi:MAG: hypothetical protein AAFU80_07515 [Pseudomonadota bacterium]